MKERQQSTSTYPLVFLLVSSTDHTTPLTGAAPTATLSKNGGAFAAAAGAVAEIGSGWYQVAGNATDTGTLGPLILHATATGADPADQLFTVVPWNPFDPIMGFDGVALPTTPVANTHGEAWFLADLIGGRIATAQGGTTTTLTLDAGASADVGAYVGDDVYLYGGTGGGARGAGQRRTVVGYNPTTKVATVHRAWDTVPDATTKFVTMPAAKSDAWMWQGAPVPAPATAGTPAVNVTQVAGQAAAAAAAVTFPATIASTTNITAGTLTSVGAVTGNVGGSVASVTGNVGGSVASVAAGVAVASIANGAVTAASVAAGSLNGKGDWLLSAGYTAPNNTGIGQIVAKLPANAIADETLVIGGVNSILAAVGSPIQAGPVTVGGYATGEDPATLLSSSFAAIPAAAADKLLGRNLAGGADGGRTVRDAMRAARNKVAFDVPSTGQFTVYAEDDTTAAWTGTYTRGPNTTGPLTGVDPT